MPYVTFECVFFTPTDKAPARTARGLLNEDAHYTHKEILASLTNCQSCAKGGI